MHSNGQNQPEKHLPKIEPLPETFKRVIATIGERKGEPEFKTGLEALDKGIFGLHRSQLTTLAARPGKGKTSFACQVAFELADRGKKVAFISLEMTKETILERIFCLTHQVNSFHLLMGNIAPEKMAKFDSFLKILETLPLKIIDDYCFTQNELYTLIEHLEFRPDVLILDHIQHIRASHNNRSERENLTEYLRYLKESAMRYKMAVLCLSQINREGEQKPTLANLKGAGSLEEMSDHVLLLETERAEGWKPFLESTIDIAKNRFGPVCSYPLLFEAGCSKFVNKVRKTLDKQPNER